MLWQYYGILLFLLIAGLSSAWLAYYAWRHTTAAWASAYVAMMAIFHARRTMGGQWFEAALLAALTEDKS